MYGTTHSDMQLQFTYQMTKKRTIEHNSRDFQSKSTTTKK